MPQTMTPNPRVIALCITLFLASASITLSLKTSSHHHNRNPSSWLPSLHRPSTSKNHRPSKDHSSPKLAYATFLAADIEHPNKDGDEDEGSEEKDNEDGYFLGTRVLAYQLLHSKTAGTNQSIPFLVLCTKDVSKRKRERLKKDGATVVVVEKLEAWWVTPNIDRWRDVLAKLRLFEMTQYHKILFIDADTLVTGTLDGVFYDEATLTQATLANPDETKKDEEVLPRTYMFASHGDLGIDPSGGPFWGYEHPWPPVTDLSYLNCGFFVFAPSKVLFKYYMSLLALEGRFDPGFPEQNLLNYAHRREGNMPWKPLWYGWNANWPSVRDWRGGARSFHAKYWDGDPGHDPFLKAIWKEQRAEMEGFHRGRDLAMGGKQ